MSAAAILRRLSDNARLISRMVLMFQREVAARIRARPGDDGYSALSVFTALYWEIDLHFSVAAGSFHPRPKVDAEVLRFTPLQKPRPSPMTRRASSSRSSARHLRAAKTDSQRAQATRLKSMPLGLYRCSNAPQIDPAARAETLDVSDFVRLSRALGPRCDVQDRLPAMPELPEVESLRESWLAARWAGQSCALESAPRVCDAACRSIFSSSIAGRRINGAVRGAQNI